MKCAHCGKDNRTGAKFCKFCGQPITAQAAIEPPKPASVGPKVFITHSWKDIKFARRFYRDLKAQGYDVWFDDRAVKAGHRLAEEINRGLAWCEVYIPILSTESLSSPWCREEINAALTLSNEPSHGGHPRIISVLVENCQDQMPPMLKARLYVSFTGSYESAFQELLTRGFGSPTTFTRTPPGGSPSVRSAGRKFFRLPRSRRAKIALGIFVLLLICSCIVISGVH